MTMVARRPSPLSRASGLQVVVAHRDSADHRSSLDSLTRLGHQGCPAGNGAELVGLCRQLRPDLVIADGGLPGLPEGLEACRAVSAPVILVGENLAAIDAHDEAVFGYLPAPVAERDLSAAIVLARRLFEQLQASRAEVTDLRQQLEERKLVERAKGAVVRRIGVDEAEAFRRMRQYSSNRNLKMASVAITVLEAEAIFAHFDHANGQSHGPPGFSPNGHNHE
jgi:response regulator NasT